MATDLFIGLVVSSWNVLAFLLCCVDLLITVKFTFITTVVSSLKYILSAINVTHQFFLFLFAQYVIAFFSFSFSFFYLFNICPDIQNVSARQKVSTGHYSHSPVSPSDAGHSRMAGQVSLLNDKPLIV